MIPFQITDSDMIILHTTESYLQSMGSPMVTNPQEKLIVLQQARDVLYSDIVRRVPRVAGYLMSANMETDTCAQGLYMALQRHVMDPVFIDILMQYLMKLNSPEENGVTGAFLTRIVSKWLEANYKPAPKTGKKDAEESKPLDTTPIQHIQAAINKLLGDVAAIVACHCGNLTQTEATAIAACLAMNNKDTISEILSADLPVTAQILDILKDPTNVIRAALLLEKNDFPKLTANQSAFVESLTRWVYDKLDKIPTQTTYQFLVAVYGSIKPKETQKYIIQIKDCGTAFSNLLTVSKQLINQ